MSDRYRAQPGSAVTLDAEGKQAYLAARFPATYAAVLRALERFRAAGGAPPRTLLDVGCGPGTASLAAGALWPDLSAVTRSDADGGWRPIAEALGQASGHDALGCGRWLTGPLQSTAFPKHDMIVAAYALNELAGPARDEAAAALWATADRSLILIEPGTPQGFLNIRRAREVLIGLGAHICAPCTHSKLCPMSERDWCHSAVRLARDDAHRRAKGGTLAYEDEKFSYLAVERQPAHAPAPARIVKRPVAHKGHVRLDLCGEDGLTPLTVSRRDGASYKAARKAEWGDAWPRDQDP